MLIFPEIGGTLGVLSKRSHTEVASLTGLWIIRIPATAISQIPFGTIHRRRRSLSAEHVGAYSFLDELFHFIGAVRL